MLEVTRRTKVYTARDQHVGNVDRIVLDPRTDKMTHIVVRRGTFLPEDKLIRTDDISTATPERINLRRDVAPDDLEPFVELQYVPLDEADHAPPAPPSGDHSVLASVMYGPLGIAMPVVDPAMRTVSERNIPDRLTALDAGAPVFTSDRQAVGHLERVVTTDAGMATHIVVQAEGLRSDRRAVPVTWIEDIDETVISLGATQRMIEAVPPLADTDW